MPTIISLLETMLDTGLSEQEFWNMTLDEIERYAASYKRKEEIRLKEKAFFYHRLGELIGVSIGRYYSQDFSYPEIYEAFDGIYTEEEVETARQEERDRQSIERLKRMYEQSKNIKE